ncbi:YbaB/EbfC family nucleoid-associated protein [Nocardia sp. CA-084685]|uniref:YbaB/EbfC family nucleoid-associated protein n=1 Tax=Nocardia sp. CA-084685 TaxID=3239970 RepID=UPI003D977A06
MKRFGNRGNSRKAAVQEVETGMFQGAAGRARLDELMDAVHKGMESIAEAQEERAKLTASASDAGSRVTVTVNADGIVIETRFAGDIDELTYDEIAAAVTKAAQRAAADVRAQSESVMAAAGQGFGTIPEFDEMGADISDFTRLVPPAPEVSLLPPPESSSRVSDDDVW